MAGIGERRPDGRLGVAVPGGFMRALSRAPAVRAREWLGVFRGHEIRVVTRGLLRARLYIDGKNLDERSPLWSRDRRVPLMSGRLPTAQSEVTLVHVYARGLWPMRIDVRVLGKSIPMNPLDRS